jgi:hypothetical protein
VSVTRNSAATLSAALVGVTTNTGVTVSYVFQVFDANGDQVEYVFEDLYAGPPATGKVASGTTVEVKRTYAYPGEQAVKLTLRDLESGTAPIHTSVFTATSLVIGLIKDYPFPFARDLSGDAVADDVSGTAVIAHSQPHFSQGGASTIDVVGTVAMSGTLGDMTPAGTKNLGSLRDIEAVDETGTKISAVGDIISIGGRGVNTVTALVNKSLPVHVETGKGVCTTDSSGNLLNCYQRSGAFGQGTPVTDYGYFSLVYQTLEKRYVFVAAGLSGPATRATTQLIALAAAGVFQGSGVVIKLFDETGDGFFETYQIVDGTGGVTPMASASSFPTPASVAKHFVVGVSRSHFNQGAASTVDVVGAVPLATRQARLVTTGSIWAVLDVDAVDATGSSITLAGDIISIGGRASNTVSALINSSLTIRVETGKGICGGDSGFCWQREGTYGRGTPVLDYAYASAYDDGTRVIEVVAGLSGQATRGGAQAIADGVVDRATNKGIVVELKDDTGDGFFESIVQVDRA